MKTSTRELYDAILQMNRGEIQGASNKLLELSKISGKKLCQAVTSEIGYNIIKEMTYAMQSASLYYYTRALEKQKHGDDISFLAYSSYAAGINATLVTTFIPILRRFAPYYCNPEEILNIEKINSYAEQEINNMTLKAIETISDKELQKAKKKVDKTAKSMLSLATKITPEVRNLSVSLGKKFAAGDFKQARRIYEYVRDEITYIHDPLGVEEVRAPEVTMKLSAGDCDDKAVLLAAMLTCIGFKACFFIADTDNDKYPDHVYTGVYLPDAPESYKPFPEKRLSDGKNFHDWIPLDPTYEDSDFGIIPVTDIGVLEYLPIALEEENE